MQKNKYNILVTILVCFILLLTGFPGLNAKSVSKAKIINVGPGRQYTVPSAAAAVAANGDTIIIDAGVYTNDAAVWTQNNLVIRGIDRPHIRAQGRHALGKGTWVIQGDNVVVENIELSGARVPDNNGAAIRLEGTSLTLRNCYIHDNQNGFLCGKNEQSVLLFEKCEFANNGTGDGRTHNIYVGHVLKFTLQYSYVHHAHIGHNVKSRAATNFILYNRIMDEMDGTSSFAIDLPNGGQSYVIGNVIQQGPDTDNSNIIFFGAEGLEYPKNEFYLVNNTIVNDRHYGSFVRLTQGTTARVVNNLFYGNGDYIVGKATDATNLAFPKKKSFLPAKKPGFLDEAYYDYRLTAKSPAINKGSDPGVVNGFNLKPSAHYIHPLKAQKRITINKIDVGAFEFMDLSKP